MVSYRLNSYQFAFGPLTPNPHFTRFRLWAPGARHGVCLQINQDDPVSMDPLSDGWYEFDCDCGPGTRYRFGVGDLWVPDPASRQQDGDVHGYSVVTDPYRYQWRHPGWRGRPWHEAVVYELHPGLLGGFPGVARHLPHLADIGVTAIELMPIAEFPGSRNWGYDGVLPFAPDSAYGTPDELKALIDEAHGLGMMVLLDVVYNHFGPDGNYLGLYAPSFFRPDIRTPWGDAIDFRQPLVRQFFAENALYWLREFRFDGLRLDAVHAIHDPTWLDDMGRFVRANLDIDRHVHLVLENDDNEATHLPGPFDAQWNDDAHHVLHVLLTGETDGYYGDYSEDTTGQLARSLMEGFVYQGEESGHRQGAARGQPSGHLPPTAFVNFLQNHDQVGNRALGERLTQLLNADPPGNAPHPLAAAIALVLLSPQIPLIFMGEEVGSTAPFQYFTSHAPELADAVRKGRLEEFAAFRAFTSRDGELSLPDPNAIETFRRCIPHLDADRPAAHAWRAFYRRTLETRHQCVVPHLPGARAVRCQVLGWGCLHAHWQLGSGRTWSLYVNLSAQPVPLAAQEATAMDPVVYETRPGAATQLNAGAVPPGALVATMSSTS